MSKNDDWTWSEDTLKSIIRRIVERRNVYDSDKKNQFDDGVVAGYDFVLDMIKNDLEIRGYNFDDFMK